MSLSILFGRQQCINAYYGSVQTNLGWRVQVYFLTSAFHRMLGLSGIQGICFDSDNIHRATVSYSNGAKVWANRDKTDWEVQGYTLPPLGYLVNGPKDFKQFRARLSNQVVDYVHSQDYLYFASEKRIDFGPVITDGALGYRAPSPGHVVFYELVKPTSEVIFRLGQLPGTAPGQKATRAWALLTRGRQLDLFFPDFRQEEDVVRFRPTEMATTVGYEVEFGPPNAYKGTILKGNTDRE
jgi:hypothetical protein